MATMDEGEKSRFLETVRRVPGFREDLRREILTGGLFEVPERLERLAATVEDQGRRIDGVAGAVKVCRPRWATSLSRLRRPCTS